MLSFKLSEEFVDSYRGKPEKFGFNGLGNIVFYRTYSRVKENGEYETWTDVCARVINGMYSLLQDHARKNKRRWDSDKAQKDAQEAFDRMFNFKWTPSGRGLWMMGTPFIHERKTSEALLNCAFIGTENIKQEGGEIFEWIANMLMLGVGVAFDTKGAGEVLVSSPRNSASTYLVDDSREGWARSIKVLVNSYLDGTDVALFDYSMVRKKGEPIKGFGGVASGPEPLMLCHDRIREYMNKNVGKKITSRTITDICNAIGACVVAGNVRRCLPYYANVQTIDGYKKIADINVGDIVVTGGIANKVTAKIDSGIQNTLIIKHRFGALECTPNHEVAVFNSIGNYVFKKASEIMVGDRLVFDSIGIDGSDSILPEFVNSQHPNSTQIKNFPTTINSDLAWLIGALHGDGHIGNDSVEISQEMKYFSILKKIQRTMYESFLVWGEIHQSGNEKMFRYRFHSVSLSSWMKKNVKRSKESISVPEFIKSSSRDVRFAYLAGLLDTDGCIRKSSTICAVSTIYLDFARDVVALLASLGIASKINTSIKSSYGGEVISHEVTVSGSRNKMIYTMCVGSHSESQKMNNSSNNGTIDFSYPKNMLTKDIVDNLSNYHDGGNINIGNIQIDCKYLPTEVLSVETSEAVQTYDIEVENVHQFTTDGIVVHNSAELALGEANDQDYIALKNYSLEENKYRQEIGWASNNSIIGDGVKQYGAIAENIRNNGEPGVVWLENIEKYGRMGEEKHDNAIGVNPCQPGFATVLTPNGIRTFNDISIGDTIWSGKQWTKITNKQYTGVKDVLVYSTNAGEFIGTENHRVVQNGAKIEVKDAQEIDLAYGNVESIDLLNWQDVMDGMVIGDGMVHKASNNKVVLIIGDNDYDYFEYKSISSLITKERSGISNKAWEVKTTITADELPHTYERTVPDRFFYGDKYVVAGFLKGLFTANGCVNGYGKRIELKQTSLKLIRQVQQMLSSLGIRSYITTTKETRVVHKNGEYVSKKSYALSISVDRYKFAKLVGFVQDYKTFAVTGETAAAKNTYEINKVTNLGKMPVYDITVEADEHTYWTGGLLVSNCSEIPLASREECNLSEIYMQNMDDEYDFQRTIKFAYLYSKAITLTYEWITDSKSRKIMMKNRRVGVGTTGIAQFLGKHSVEDLVGWWDRGYKLIQSYDDRYSQWLGIPKSIRTTTIKPSGTVSLLAGATPGIHYPHDNFYIRRVRIQDDTPMLTALQYAGYKIEKDVYSANTSVIEIPIKVEGETSKNKTLWEQLQLASLAQRYWSDNSVSVTISFKPSDVTSEEIANAISLYAGELKCVSMLPITEEGQYEQMPYESITKEKYEEMIGDITPIANLAEHMSIVNKMKDLYCENDSCVIK